MDQNVIRLIFKEVLTIGLLKIREAAGLGKTNICKLEADHLHNVPDLVLNPNPDLVKYYYFISKPDYERAASGITNVKCYIEHWRKIESWLDESIN